MASQFFRRRLQNSWNTFDEVKWDASADHDKPNFKGYEFTTCRVNSSGSIRNLLETSEAGMTGRYTVMSIRKDTARTHYL